MNELCDHCQAFHCHFKAKSTAGHFTTCCHNGLVYSLHPRVNHELKLIAWQGNTNLINLWTNYYPTDSVIEFLCNN